MRSMAPIALAVSFAAVPARAQLNTYYTGMVREAGKEVPATAQFSLEPGRVAVIMKGARASRMLFLEKEQVLRFVDDTHGNYVDLGKGTRQGLASGATQQLGEMQKQLNKLPPEQRRMAQEMMQSTLGAVKDAPPSEYVWTKDRKTISGYEVTRVDVMQGGVKKAEYWGSTSDDFKMSDAERQAMLAMQDYLRNYLIMVSPAGGENGEARAFQWDTSVDGYPVLSRCFRGDEMTLELQLKSVDRKALSKDLFEIPSGYKKQDIPGGGR